VSTSDVLLITAVVLVPAILLWLVAATIIGKLFDVRAYDLMPHLLSPQLALTIVMVTLVLGVDAASKIEPIKATYVRHPGLRCAGILAMFQTILLFGAFTGAPFIYFQF
jgi:hypothetical protein